MEHEAEILNAIDCPLVPRNPLFKRRDGAGALFYDHIPGTTLQSLLEAPSARLTGLALSVRKDVSLTLEALDRIAVTHGDLSTKNLIITPTDRCHLIDFGRARLTASSKHDPARPVSNCDRRALEAILHSLENT